MLFDTLNAELNPICHLLALLRVHPIVHISRIRVNLVLHISIHTNLVLRIQVHVMSEWSQCFAGLCHFHLQGSSSPRRMKLYMRCLRPCLTPEDEGTTILQSVRNPSSIAMLPHSKRPEYPKGNLDFLDLCVCVGGGSFKIFVR